MIASALAAYTAHKPTGRHCSAPNAYCTQQYTSDTPFPSSPHHHVCQAHVPSDEQDLPGVVIAAGQDVHNAGAGLQRNALLAGLHHLLQQQQPVRQSLRNAQSHISDPSLRIISGQAGNFERFRNEYGANCKGHMVGAMSCAFMMAERIFIRAQLKGPNPQSLWTASCSETLNFISHISTTAS